MDKAFTFIKRIILFFIFLLVACSVSGCDDDGGYKSVVGEKEIGGTLICVSGNQLCSEWEDTETGVHYFYVHDGGLTLRVMPDGSPYIKAEESKEEPDHE